MPGVAFNQSGAAGRRDQPVPARRQLQYEPGGDRWRAGDRLRRRTGLRFRPHSRRSRGPHRNDSRRAIGGLRIVRQQRRGGFRDAAAGGVAAAGSAGRGRQPQRTPLRDHRQRDRRGLRPAGVGVALRHRRPGGQQRLPQRRRAAQSSRAASARQSLALHGYFDSNEVGEPGPWGSDPKHTFTGIDRVSRGKNNFSEYGAHYEADLSPRVRKELFGSFFLDNNGFISPYGFSYNKDLRGQGESRTIVSVSRARHGVVRRHRRARRGEEHVHHRRQRSRTFPIQRNEVAVYAENRFEIGGRLFLNAGLRGEFFRTPSIPADGFSRPFFPQSTISRVNPKVSRGLRGARRHAAARVVRDGDAAALGLRTGVHQQSGAASRSARAASMPGSSRSFGKLLVAGRHVLLQPLLRSDRDAGRIADPLSHYKSDNLANSRAQGAEFSARLRPARWVFVTGSYTLLETRILSLDGSTTWRRCPFRWASS